MQTCKDIAAYFTFSGSLSESFAGEQHIYANHQRANTSTSNDENSYDENSYEYSIIS